jgi:hypothetical protein
MTSIDIGIEVRTDMREKFPSSAAMVTRDANIYHLEIEYGRCLKIINRLLFKKCLRKRKSSCQDL